jgi:hypothetical protein
MIVPLTRIRSKTSARQSCEHSFHFRRTLWHTAHLMLSDKSHQWHHSRLAHQETRRWLKWLCPGESYNITFPQNTRESQSCWKRTARKLDSSSGRETFEILTGGASLCCRAFPCLTTVARVGSCRLQACLECWHQDSTRTDQAQHASTCSLPYCLHRGWARFMLDRLKDLADDCTSHEDRK